MFLLGSSLKSYGMNRNHRGKCLIINNSEFQDEAYSRPGAEFDEQALEALFEYLSFDVEIYQNLDSRDMRELVRTIASENHSESDALFVIVMRRPWYCLRCGSKKYNCWRNDVRI